MLSPKDTMCGICGFNWDNKVLIRKMTDVLNHRGPDDEGFYVDNNVSLGHKRLSIIDLSKRGQQPIYNEDKSMCVIYNGEIYNFKELRNELEKKHKFYTNSDSEVIIHAYEEFGEKCVEHFNGMFAFAIWDSENKKLFLARDRLGIKPLFYYFKDGKFIFSSEIKSILQEIIPEFNHNVLSQLFSCWFHLDNETLFKNIFELPPGHTISFSNDNLKINRYWKLKIEETNFSEQFYIENLKRLLKESVNKRLISDVSLGVTLSGGLDSSTIVALMSELGNKEIKTFTSGYGEDDDEFRYARLVAEKFNTDHHEILIPYNNITDSIPKILWHMETVLNKETQFPTYFYSKEIKKEISVALIGEGSDEVFAGYPRHRIFSSNFHITKNTLNLYNLRFALSRFFPNNFKIKQVRLHTLTKSEKNKIVSKELNNFKLYKTIDSYIKNNKSSSILNRFLLFEIEKELPNSHLNRVDKMTMAHAVEARVPFLDHELVEFGMTIPSNLKINRGQEKYILKRAVKDILPKEILHRKKVGLKTPFNQWFEKDLFKIIPNIMEKAKTRQYLNKRGVEKLLNRPILDIRGYYKMRRVRQLLFLTMLELFHRIFFENDNLYKPKLSLDKLI